MDDKPGAPPAEEGDIEIGSKTLGGANQFGWGGGQGQGGSGGYPPPGGVGGYPPQGNVGGFPPQGNVGGLPHQGNVGGFPHQGNVGGYPPQGGFGSQPGMPPFMPGNNTGYPPGSGAPPPYQGTTASGPGYGYGNPYPPTSASPSFHSPAGTTVGTGPNGNGMYPQLGFNPALLTTSQAYMECPICMEVLMKPIYQCSNGHIICNSCIERSNFCGQCRVPLAGPRIRNVALEQITETMEVKCPNHLDGCGTIAMGEQLKRHLEICNFQAVNICSKFLGFSDCAQKVTTAVAPVHLKEVHQAEIKDKSKFAMRLIAKSSVFETIGQAVSWGPIVITSVFDSDIVLTCHTTPQGQLSITGYLIGCSEESHKLYRVKLQLDSQRSRLEWTGGLLSLRHHNIADHLLNQNTFQVPLQSLKEFIKSHHDPVDDLQDQTKLRVKVALWKLSDGDNKPYKECFTNLETGAKETMEKLILHSKPYRGSSSISSSSQSAFPISQPASMPAMSLPSYSSPAETSYGGYPSGRDYTATNSSSYPYPSGGSGNNCRNCNQALFGVFYQCLQCPEGTFYCQRCIEQTRAHANHLTLRISSLDQQTLAAVVYECAAGDIN